jgi:hypothetical protein
MIVYAFDTGIVSYFLENDNTVQNEPHKEIDKGNDFVIPSTVYFELQQQGKGIGDDDLFIAAYCLKHNLPLVTGNTRHFIHVEYYGNSKLDGVSNLVVGQAEAKHGRN